MLGNIRFVVLWYYYYQMVRDESSNGVEDGKEKLKNCPFEFVALETCLETVCNCLDDEVIIST